MIARFSRLIVVCCFLPIVLGACHRSPPSRAGLLPQEGYLWQRNWNPAVQAAAREAGRHLNGIVVLGAEIVWEGDAPQVAKSNISWDDLREATVPITIGLRVAPSPMILPKDGPQVGVIARVAKSLLAEARGHGVAPTGFQIDFDCAQKKLSGYREWLPVVVAAVRPLRIAITALPAWLDEPAFPALAREADDYVLQVHSVPTVEEAGRFTLCDPALARRWVNKAAALGLPFSVSLPTYWCLAGYDPGGKLIGVAMDSVEPAWPPGTRTLAFDTDPDEMANLVRGWQSDPPVGLRDILWYRIPIATDRRNWGWITLQPVMEGRSPKHRLELIREGESPVDLSLRNTGEAEEAPGGRVTVRWKGAVLLGFDALAGWTISADREEVVFSADRDGSRLSPGAEVGVGWLRFEGKTPELQIQVSQPEGAAR